MDGLFGFIWSLEVLATNAVKQWNSPIHHWYVDHVNGKLLETEVLLILPTWCQVVNRIDPSPWKTFCITPWDKRFNFAKCFHPKCSYTYLSSACLTNFKQYLHFNMIRVFTFSYSLFVPTVFTLRTPAKFIFFLRLWCTIPFEVIFLAGLFIYIYKKKMKNVFKNILKTKDIIHFMKIYFS